MDQMHEITQEINRYGTKQLRGQWGGSGEQWGGSGEAGCKETQNL